MAYVAGTPQLGPAFSSIGASTGGLLQGMQNQQDDLLRRFYAALAANPGAQPNAFQPASVPKAGAFLNPDQPLTGIDDPGGGVIPVGGAQQLAPTLSGPQQYVKNAGVNALLNSIIGKGAAGGAAKGLLASL